MPSLLERVIASERAAILDRNDAAVRRLLDAYRASQGRLRPLVALLQAEVNALGPDVSEATLVKLDRWKQLDRLIVEETNRLSRTIAVEVVNGQRDAVRLGAEAAERLTLAALPEGASVGAGFVRLPAAATQELVGALSPGSPLAKLLAGFGDEAGATMRAELLDAMIRGRSPDAVAEAVDGVLGRNRALTIARTSIMQAHRSAARRTYVENRSLVPRFMRLAAKSEQTCVQCLSLDGTIQSVDEEPATHPNCRCSIIPLVAGDDLPDMETGAAWFDQQPPDVQDRILGSSALGSRVRAGDFTLRDLTRIDNDPRWGPTTRRATIAEAESAAERRVRRVAA